MNLARVFFALSISTLLVIFTLTPPTYGANIDRQLARQSVNNIFSFLTRQQTTKAPVNTVDAISSGTASAATAATSSISTMANLASGIQSIPSIQSILDASGITRLTDPVWNQVRKQWQNIVNR